MYTCYYQRKYVTDTLDVQGGAFQWSMMQPLNNWLTMQESFPILAFSVSNCVGESLGLMLGHF